MATLYIVNTKIDPCDSGMFEDQAYLVNREGRMHFLKRIHDSGAPDFTLPFLNLYRSNSQSQKRFLGPIRQDREGLKRWDFQHSPKSTRVIVGGEVRGGRIGTLAVWEYIYNFLAPNELTDAPIKGIIQFLGDNHDIHNDLYPEDMRRLEELDSVETKRIYLE